MGKRGAKRKYNKNIPKHINQGALPDGCYWDNGASPHWYIKYFIIDDVTSKKLWRRKKVASPNAKLSDLHDIMERDDLQPTNTFRFIANEYIENSNFFTLGDKTRRDYMICFDRIKQFKTKVGIVLADVPLEDFKSVLVQRYIDTMKDKATQAKHVHAFIRRVFAWAKNRGYVTDNPAIGIELPDIVTKVSFPTQQAYDRLLDYAKHHGTHGQKVKGSCPHYIWAVMEITYLCYLRGIETRELTDGHIANGVLVADRKKGSETNKVKLNERLIKAIDYLQASRKEIWSKAGVSKMIRPADRPLIVNTIGEALTESAYHSSWQRFVTARIKEGIITNDQRFSMHGLKHKGCTDSTSHNPAGHKDPRMQSHYDHTIKTVDAASE